MNGPNSKEFQVLFFMIASTKITQMVELRLTKELPEL